MRSFFPFEYLTVFVIALSACNPRESREITLDFSRLPASLPLTLPPSQVESIFDDSDQKTVFLNDLLPEILAQTHFFSFTDRKGNDRGECTEENDANGALKKITVSRRGAKTEKIRIGKSQKEIRDYSTQRVIALVDIDSHEEKILSNYEVNERWEIGESEILRFSDLSDNFRCDPKATLNRFKVKLEELVSLLVPIQARVVITENQKWTLPHLGEAIARTNKREVRFYTDAEGIVSRGLSRAIWFESNRVRHPGYQIEMKTTAARPLTLETTSRTKGILRNKITDGQVEASLSLTESGPIRSWMRWILSFKALEWDTSSSNASKCWPSKGAIKVQVLPQQGFRLDTSMEMEFLPDRKIAWKDSRGRAGTETISSSLFLGHCEEADISVKSRESSAGLQADSVKVSVPEK